MKIFRSLSQLFSRIPRPLMRGAVLVIASGLLILAADSLAGAFIAGRIRREIDDRGILVQIEGLRISPLGGRIAFDRADIQLSGPVFLGIRDVSLRMGFVRAYRAYRAGGLQDVGALRPHDLPSIWNAIESAEAAGMLPRKLTVGQVEAGPISGSFNLSTRQGRIILQGGFALAFGKGPGEEWGATVSGSLNPSRRELRGSLDISAGQDLFLDLVLESDADGTRFPLTGTLRGRPSFLPAWDHLDISYDFSGALEPGARPPRFRPEVAAMPEPSPALGILKLDEGRGEINGVAADVALEIWGLFPGPADGNGRRSPVLPEEIRLGIRADGADINAALDLLPPEYLGDLSRAEISGAINGSADIILPPGYLRGIEWDLNLTVEEFEVITLPARYDLFSLDDGFIHTIVDPSVEFTRIVRIPPYRRPSLEWMRLHSERSDSWIGEHWARREGNGDIEAAGDEGAGGPEPDPGYRYVYLEEMSRWVVSAILTGEDGDFFFHRGVDWNTVSDAIARNVAEGEIVLGASTLTMQLAKNLFLSDDREFSRKLRELMLVYLIEDYVNLPKDRILELYINLVEFGPGIFGISDAARHYFGKDPSELNAGEAVWLASILPSPKRYYQYYENGGISPGWFERMKWNFDTMLERGRMNDAEYAAATAAIPRFYYGE
jgi:hypothetical protein